MMTIISVTEGIEGPPIIPWCRPLTVGKGGMVTDDVGHVNDGKVGDVSRIGASELYKMIDQTLGKAGDSFFVEILGASGEGTGHYLILETFNRHDFYIPIFDLIGGREKKLRKNSYYISEG